MRIIISLFNNILNALFPPVCFGCRKKDITLCDKCIQNCARAIDTPAIYIESIYSFRDPLIKKIIHSIKYFHRRDLIEPLTRALADEMMRNFASQNPSGITTHYSLPTAHWTLIPIPMSRFRKYMRGYNQAELITKEISNKSGIPYNNKILSRSRATKQQVKTTTKSERLKNQSNSFVVTSPVNNMNIILVDDVTTTGATIDEARKVLLKAGATKVRAITLAH